MAEPLSEAFLNTRLVAPEILEEAAQRQVLYGGSLDTNLLELGTVSEAQILQTMEDIFRLPVANKSDIDHISSTVPSNFPLAFAETYHLVPYRMVAKNLAVLLNRLPDMALFKRIQERVQLHVTPTLTTEVRVHYAMHRLYGTNLLPRYKALLEKLDGAPLQDAPASVNESVTWGLRSTTTPSSTMDSKRNAIDIPSLVAKLASATSRDTIIDTVLEVTLSTFSFAALFLVQNQQVMGWRSSTSEATEKIARFVLPLEIPSVFQTIYATHGHYLGPLPANSANRHFIEQIGREPPRTAFLVPLTVGGKLAAILYADNGRIGVPSKRVASTLVIVHRAGLCLENLIRQKKVSTIETGLRVSSNEHTPSVTVLDDHEFELLHHATADSVPSAIQSKPSPPPLPKPLLTESAEEDTGDGWSDVRVENDLNYFKLDTSAAAVQSDFANALQSVPATPAQPKNPPPPVEEPEIELDASYVAFADVEDHAEASLDQWEDVLLDASGSADSQQVSRKETAPPAVTWEAVIAEAEAAPELHAKIRAPQLQIAGSMVDERDLLFDSIESEDAVARQGAIERLLKLGSAVDDMIKARFPGRLNFDPFANSITLPYFEMCSGITALLKARGPNAAPLVLAFLEHDDRLKRFFAIYFFYSVPYNPALEVLARRLYDTEPRNRHLAAEALRNYDSLAGYQRILVSLRENLKVPLFDTQISTIQILGQLRDPNAVPSLIPLVVSPRPQVARAAQSALAVICAQAFNNDVSAWAEWWQARFNKPRELWLVEALRHSHPGIQNLAHAELQTLAGKPTVYDPSHLTPLPEETIRLWEVWWQQVQDLRSRSFAHKPSEHLHS